MRSEWGVRRLSVHIYDAQARRVKEEITCWDDNRIRIHEAREMREGERRAMAYNTEAVWIPAVPYLSFVQATCSTPNHRIYRYQLKRILAPFQIRHGHCR